MRTDGDAHRLSSPLAGLNTNDESVELARFRAEWKAEVERRRNHSDDSAQSTKEKTVDGKEDNAIARWGVDKKYLLNKPATRATAGARTSGSTEQAAPTVATSHPAIRDGIITQAATSEKHERALVYYREAIEHEQSGHLDAALASYRQAFRLVRPPLHPPHSVTYARFKHENVDRAYQREQLLKAKLQNYTE